MISISKGFTQDFSNDKKSLDLFVGNWTIQGSVSEEFSGSPGEVNGSTSYGWSLGGSWLKFESSLQIQGVGEYEVHGGVAYNPNQEKYDAYSVNNLGFMIIYEGEWQGNRLVFTQVYPFPGGNSRVVYQVNGSTLAMISEKRNNQDEWKVYYEYYLTQNKEP